MITTRKHIEPRGETLSSVVRHLKEGYEVDYVPRGNDMLPLIRGGKDVVTLRKIGEPVRRGDIVLVCFPGDDYRLSRVMDSNQNRFYLLRETALSWSEQENCTLNDILGKVVFIQRGSWGFRPGRGDFWMSLLPVRRYIMALYRRLRRKNYDTNTE